MSILDLKLDDYRRWKTANSSGSFSLLDYVHAVLRVQEAAAADLLVGIAGLMWPDFVAEGGSVFLEMEFERERVGELRKQMLKSEEVEMWANMVCVDGLLDGMRGNSEAVIDVVAERLRGSWAAKLCTDFPERTFRVSILRDTEFGDVCVSFCELRDGGKSSR